MYYLYMKNWLKGQHAQICYLRKAPSPNKSNYKQPWPTVNICPNEELGQSNGNAVYISNTESLFFFLYR